MNDLIAITLSYAFIVVFSFFIMNFLTNGFVIKYILAKASRGKKILVELYTVTGIDYTLGTIEKDLLNYKNPSKENKRIKIDDSHVVRKMQVNMVIIDDITDKVLTKNITEGKQIDAKLLDQIIVRIMNMPQVSDNKEKILLGIIVIILLLVIVIVFFNYDILNTVKSLKGVTGRI